jgi:hypothetical protein
MTYALIVWTLPFVLAGCIYLHAIKPANDNQQERKRG